MRLTEKQTMRLQNLAASGPLTRKPIDDELDAMGWTERYDDDDTASELVDGGTKALYAENGCIKPELIPEAWIQGGRNENA